jgi:hypothetical protein
MIGDKLFMCVGVQMTKVIELYDKKPKEIIQEELLQKAEEVIKLQQERIEKLEEYCNSYARAIEKIEVAVSQYLKQYDPDKVKLAIEKAGTLGFIKGMGVACAVFVIVAYIFKTFVLGG